MLIRPERSYCNMTVRLGGVCALVMLTRHWRYCLPSLESAKELLKTAFNFLYLVYMRCKGLGEARNCAAAVLYRSFPVAMLTPDFLTGRHLG